MKNWTKEWCSITLFNRFKICLSIDFDLSNIDLLMIGLQLRRGIGLTILGLTISLEWKRIS